MSYPTNTALIELFKRTHWVITQHAADLSHADTLIQPPHSGNCFNWVLGHIIAGRHSVLVALGEEPLWEEAKLAVYKRESEPITAESQAHPFEVLLADLAESQTRILAALDRCTSEQLAAYMNDNPDERHIGERIAFLHWHETYHSGQLELLRQLAGRSEKLI